MGMYPVQNYGRDFNESLIGMGNFISGQRKTEADLKQRDLDNARQSRLDEQSLKASEASIAASTASTEKNVFDLEKSKREDAKVKDLERIMDMVSTYSIETGKVNSAPKKYSKEYLQSFSNGVTELSNLPNNISDPNTRERFKADNSAVLDGYSLLSQMPASEQLYIAKRGDAPEIDATLAAKERLMPKAQFTKVHVNDQYGEYTLANLEQIGVVSADGTAKTADWFSIKDKAGNPIYEKDATGQPVMVQDPATGQPVPKKVLVPSTFGHTNDPESKVKFDLSQLEQAKSQLGLQMLSVYEGMTPEQQQQVQDMNIAKLRASTNPAAIAFMERWDGKKDKKGVALAEGAIYIDGTTGKKIAENPKAEKADYKSRTRQDGTSEVFEESQDGGRTWKRVSAGPKFNPKGDNGGKSTKELERESRADIDKSAAELARRRVSVNKNSAAANASGDPESIRAATADAESYNAESATLTEKFEAHKRNFGKSYTPTASNPPVKKSGGMAPSSAPPPPPQQKKTVTAAPVYAVDPQTKQRIMSYDGGKSWQPAR